MVRLSNPPIHAWRIIIRTSSSLAASTSVTTTSRSICTTVRSFAQKKTWTLGNLHLRLTPGKETAVGTLAISLTTRTCLITVESKEVLLRLKMRLSDKTLLVVVQLICSVTQDLDKGDHRKRDNSRILYRDPMKIIIYQSQDHSQLL